MGKSISKCISVENERQLLRIVKGNDKYRLIVLLMLDCGLRVSEAAALKVENIRVGQNCIRIKSLKKKSDNPIFREVPLTDRVRDALADYLYGKDLKSFVFPTTSKEGHLSRKRIWSWLARNTSYAIKPHDLRHAFASKIVNEGNDIRVAQDLLGHHSSTTTEIYLHRPVEAKIRAIKSIQKPSIFKKVTSVFKKKKKINLSVQVHLPDNLSIGRKVEVMKLRGLAEKKINTFVTGSQGTGKTHLLKSVRGEKVLRLDDFRSVKKTLGNILLFLFQGDKSKIITLLAETSDIEKIITKESTTRLIELMTKSCEKGEYTLLIDDVTSVTAMGVSVLDKLKNHFHIICAARQVKVQHASFLSNFERIELNNLKRSEAGKLIFLLSAGFKDRIESFEAYKTHILNQSDCNPLFITELVERFSKESYITSEEVSVVRHFRTKQTFDFSFIIVLCLSSLMVLRYVGGELDSDSGAFKLIGGVFLVFALFARSIFRVGRKKFA